MLCDAPRQRAREVTAVQIQLAQVVERAQHILQRIQVACHAQPQSLAAVMHISHACGGREITFDAQIREVDVGDDARLVDAARVRGAASRRKSDHNASPPVAGAFAVGR